MNRRNKRKLIDLTRPIPWHSRKCKICKRLLRIQNPARKIFKTKKMNLTLIWRTRSCKKLITLASSTPRNLTPIFTNKLWSGLRQNSQKFQRSHRKMRKIMRKTMLIWIALATKWWLRWCRRDRKMKATMSLNTTRLSPKFQRFAPWLWLTRRPRCHRPLSTSSRSSSCALV